MKFLSRFAAVVVTVALALPVQQARANGIFDIYENNRANGISNYITQDLMLASYWLILSDAITQYEEAKAAPALNELVVSLLADTKLEPSNRQFLELIQALATGKTQTGSPVVDAELKRITDAAGPAKSELFRQQIDYTQFKIRGKYSRTEGLRHYFAASKLASAVLFPVLESASTGITAADADELTKRALDLVRAIDANSTARKASDELTSGLEFLFGPADDLTIEHYRKFASKTPAEARQALFALGLRPFINSAIVDTSSLEGGRSVSDVVTGWRLLPQRFTAESAAFQELVFDKVKDFKGSGTPFTSGSVNGKLVKAFPTALELMAIQGSKIAEVSLGISGDTNYDGYAAARLQASKLMLRATGLNALHLAFLKRQLASANKNDLTAALAFWTEDRYGSILYAKQSYTAVAKGLVLAPERHGAWIDARPALFLSLADLADTVGKRLGSAKLIALAKESKRCSSIAAVAAKSKVLPTQDEDYLNRLDTTLIELTGKKDAPIVVDVHTDANSGMVLQEAIGDAIPAEQGKAKGGRFSQYEFKQPMRDRLTDQVWIQMLAEGKLPPANLLRAK